MIPKTTDEQAAKVIDLLKSQPNINYSEISRQTGLSFARIRTVCIKNNIKRKRVKDSIADMLREHPYWSYPIIANMTGYGKGNVARLAKAIGQERKSNEILAHRINEVNEQLEQQGELDIPYLSKKYGLPEDFFESIQTQFQEKNKQSGKDVVYNLLTTTKLNFSCIAFLARCDLSYVSRLAKKNNISRLERNNSNEYNMSFILKENPNITCGSLLLMFPKADVDTIIRIAEQNNIHIELVSDEEKKIIKNCYSRTESIIDTCIKTNINEYLIEFLLKEEGLIKKDSAIDKKCIQYLRDNPRSSYTEAARAFDYFSCFVKDIAVEKSINRPVSVYSNEDKTSIINLLKTRPNWSYDDISQLTGRSVYSIQKIAKEEKLAHNLHKK